MSTQAKQKSDPTRIWKEIQARLDEVRPSRRRGTSRPFTEYAWNQFIPREIIAILATPGESYFAHKEVLYDGFCAWVVNPGVLDPRVAEPGVEEPFSVTLPKHAMALRVALHLDAAEKAGRKIFGDSGRLGDILIRTYLVDQEFFEEMYYPIGGISRIAKSFSRSGYRGKLAKSAYMTECAVNLVEIYHYHVEHLLPKIIYGKPSLNSGAPLVKLLNVGRGRIPEDRQIKTFWRYRKSSAAFAYAAKSIVFEDGQSLLDAIFAGKSSWKQHAGIFPRWLARTRYVAERVLSNCAEVKTAHKVISMLPSGLAEELEVPPFSDSQISIIESGFVNKRS